MPQETKIILHRYEVFKPSLCLKNLPNMLYLPSLKELIKCENPMCKIKHPIGCESNCTAIYSRHSNRQQVKPWLIALYTHITTLGGTRMWKKHEVARHALLHTGYWIYKHKHKSATQFVSMKESWKEFKYTLPTSRNFKENHHQNAMAKHYRNTLPNILTPYQKKQ